MKIKVENEIESVVFSSSVINLSHTISYIGVNNLKNILIVISENTAKSLDLSKIDNFFIIDNSYKISFLSKIMYRFGVKDYVCEILSHYLAGSEKIYGVDHGALYFLYKNKSMYVFEDGVANYSKRSCSVLKMLFNKLSNDNSFPFGRGSNVEKVFLTNPDICVDLNNRNVFKIDIRRTLDVMKELSLFKFNGDFRGLKNGVLITQPLSEDSVITESEKLRIYKEIIKKEDVKYIKPHPRETTDYSSLAFVIPSYFPAELLYFLNERPNKIVTLFSSSVDYLALLDQDLKIVKYGSFGNTNIKFKFNI